MDTEARYNTRYQITTFEKFSQFSRVAGQSIINGLQFDDVEKWLEGAKEMDEDMGGDFSFIDKDGNLNQVRRYLLPA